MIQPLPKIKWSYPERLAWLPPDNKDALIVELQKRLRVIRCHVAAAERMLETLSIEGGADGSASEA